MGRLCAASICLRPIDAPTPARHCRPDQALLWCAARVMVKYGRTLIEPACVPRIGKSELLKIEMMAELVT